MKHIGTILSDDSGYRNDLRETKVTWFPTVTGAPSSSLKRALEASKGRATAISRGWTSGRDVTIAPADVREAQAYLRALEEGDLREAGPAVPAAFMLEMVDLLPSTAHMRNGSDRVARYVEHLSKLPVGCFTQQTLMHVLRASVKDSGAFLLSYPEIETILLASIQSQRDLAANLRAVVSAGRRDQHNSELRSENDRPTPESAARTVADLEQMPASDSRAQSVRLYHHILQKQTPELVEQYGPRLRRLLAATPVSTVVEQLRALDAQTAPARGAGGTAPVAADSVKESDHRVTAGGPTGSTRHSTSA